MLRIVFAFVILITSFGSSASEATSAPAGPRPIAVLLTTDPWLMVIGSDTPWFALYDDGLVIYLEQTSKDKFTHMSARLTPTELASVKAKLLSYVAEPVPKEINVRPGWTDQPQSKFFVEVDGHTLVTSVYGLGTPARSEEDLPGGGEGADALPDNIKGLHQYLSEFHVAAATQWIPEQIEVMIWDYSHAPDASIQWPTRWPGLSDPTTRKRRDDYSIYLPGTEEGALVALLATQKEKGAVEIDGKKWSVAYRYVFPRWRDSFKE
ncbi:hypothetical protein [Pseudoxanthomonas indica]|uniref:Uncharacterized protein n=1 Tax=Pseudoxanthomonas indica TaxID=428993 RepID=A0A1T5KAV4_9GAMM|nr:hypothetical protein [Pseudoxanthomonas indica]GGD48072.1 hypothetical protein GCM10007235_19910 [Pseudoxanthomonas indica]SKC60862.1 hypothetical protein SAMN06296058_1530 [Pseudoxanthomonas indica]